MTGKGRELADMMERRKVDILCVQETRWKGSKARSIGAGFKLFYYGVDSKRNGVGVVLKEEFVRNVLEVKRVSDRVMSLKLEIEGVMLNVVSGYAPQVGCELEEKERFWSELDEVMESIPTGERVMIGADFNGHVGEGNTGDEEVMGKFGVKERNLEGQMVVDFAKRMDMAVVNTYFQKREEHRVTYKSGGRRTQVVLPDDWETTAEVIRETGRKVLGVSSGRRKEDKETWWWNEEVQDSIQRKRLAKKKWDMDRTEENRQEYKELQRRVKREVSKAKQKAYDELYTRLDTREGEKDLYRLARQRDRDGKDVQQVRVIKDRDGRVLTSEESVQRRWKEYFEELMNEENEREKRVEGVNSVEQKVDKIRKDEVRKALKRMKSGKAVGPDDIPVEVWECLGEAAVEFLTSLFNRVLENLEKAYDRVPREELWYCMRKSGVAEKYVRMVQDMYERSRTVVRCAVVMDQLSEEVRQESPWTMMFADDIVICSESREQVEENLERWRFALERRGMKVSRIQSNGECGKEVKKRVQAGWNGWRKVSGVLCDRKISARIKGKVYRTVVRAAMLYGLETVSLRKRQESELEDAASLLSAEDGPDETCFFFLFIAGTRSASFLIGGGDRRPHLPPSLPVGAFGPAGLRSSLISTTRQGTSFGAAARRWTSFGSAARRFRESGTISVRKGQGRKTILDARDLRALGRHCITYRNATVMEITTWAQEYFQKTLSVNTIHRAIRRRRLKLYRSKKKPYLNMIQKCRRFLWAKARLKWTVAKWKTVLWSDQSKFEVLFGKPGRHVIRTKEDKDNPSCYQRSVQKPASLMVWGCMSACGMGSLHIWKGTINAESTNFIPDRSRPGLTTTAIGAVDLQGAGGNWATVGGRSRGGRRVHRQREKRKGKSVGLRIGTLNVGTMTGKGRELPDMMERRKVDILCVQETRWKGSKARSIGAGFKLFYYGVDSKRNGVGVVLKEEFVRNVLEVKRVSDRVMSLKLEIEGVMLNVVSGYAPQVGCELEEKERFWSELDEVMESIPTGERVVIGADFNGHVGEGNTGDEEVMGKFGVKERNL
ncbi:hypothetical protein QTP86_000457 [Hemibagrus guttatus]|nr:hypothetical protein QTP86_000457 [Hemibagrus guttatus]